MRIPHAAKQLLHDVQQVSEKATMEPYGPPDGYGVVRVVRFDADTSVWLVQVLDAIGDPRVVDYWASYDGDDERLAVQFVSTWRADRRTRFPVQQVTRILFSD